MKASVTSYCGLAVLMVILLSPPASAQISGSWSTAPSAGFSPCFMAASGVVNGKIYIISGLNGNDLLNSVQMYDPASRSWNTITTSGILTPRYGFSCATLDGKIYAMGGYSDSCLNTLEVFDPSTNLWNTPATSGTFTPRAHLTASVVDGKIYAIGGVQYDMNQHQIYLNTIEVFDPSNNTWSSVIPSAGSVTGRSSHVAEAINGKIYLIGGYGVSRDATIEIFDPVANTVLQQVTTGAFNWCANASSAVIDNKIIVLGGYNGIKDTNIVRVLDPATNVWSAPNTTGKFSSHEGLMTGVIRQSTHGGAIAESLYAIGGFSNAGFLSTNEVLTVAPASVSASVPMDIAIFPNPVRNILTIEHGNDITHLEILDILGKSVLEINPQRSVVDLSNIPSGIYSLRMQSPYGTSAQKIIKE